MISSLRLTPVGLSFLYLFLFLAGTASAQDSLEEVDRARQESIEALVETAKARFVIDNPDREGATAGFEEIAPYILINGVPPANISELEKRGGAKILSLGRYPGETANNERIRWGEAISQDSLGTEEENLPQISFDEGLSEGELERKMMENELGDADAGFIFPPLISNPAIMLFVDGNQARKVLYRRGKPLDISVLSQGQVGPVYQRDFQHAPSSDLQERIDKVLKISEDSGSEIPGIQEQIQLSLPAGGNWNTADIVQIVHRKPDGEIGIIGIVYSFTWTGAGDLPGAGYPNEFRTLANDLLNLEFSE